MAEETQSLEQTLENTGLGHFVNTNKDSILIGVGILLAAIIGISVYQHNIEKNDQALLNQLYQFNSQNITAFLEQDKESKVTEDQVIEALTNAKLELVQSPNFLPTLFDVTRKLEDSGSAVKLIPVFEKVIAEYKPNEYGYLFLGLKLAVFYENNENLDKAISTLETLVSANHDIVKTKVYLDLGRLYKKTGQKDKAKSNFDYIVKNEKNAEYVKLAKLFLSQL